MTLESKLKPFIDRYFINRFLTYVLLAGHIIGRSGRRIGRVEIETTDGQVHQYESSIANPVTVYRIRETNDSYVVTGLFRREDIFLKRHIKNYRERLLK